ncbi:uncharacterized protein M6B38_251165 [Iris pallida]|uniref:Uncharacterized protein n=1 Tax=Iris pallida TaxID=29817 RepID=A0AAX6IJW5_IRIPA|nr:uncharacterized protein M6B38_251165 [Iris pallida]
MTMSRRYLSSLTEAMNLDSRSSLDEKPSLRLCLITSPASTSTSPIALRSSLSDPQSSSRFAFHHHGEVAVARLARGSSPGRRPPRIRTSGRGRGRPGRARRRSCIWCRRRSGGRCPAGRSCRGWRRRSRGGRGGSAPRWRRCGGVGADGAAAELEAGHLALEVPELAVGVEDPVAEEVPEDGGEGLPLGEVVEVGLEHVLDVVRVGGDDVVEDVDVDGLRGRVAEEVGVPVDEVGEVGGPRGVEVGLADVAVAPGVLGPQDEEEREKERKERVKEKKAMGPSPAQPPLDVPRPRPFLLFFLPSSFFLI